MHWSVRAHLRQHRSDSPGPVPSASGSSGPVPFVDCRYFCHVRPHGAPGHLCLADVRLDNHGGCGVHCLLFNPPDVCVPENWTFPLNFVSNPPVHGGRPGDVGNNHSASTRTSVCVDNVFWRRCQVVGPRSQVLGSAPSAKHEDGAYVYSFIGIYYLCGSKYVVTNGIHSGQCRSVFGKRYSAGFIFSPTVSSRRTRTSGIS
mmetsp:Transcript_5096/g.14277  ORF Transcript_5096/g.14277 Transcript_5096/m.14277 type:complete len:202 (+) Transcript_5096:1417-2022(+)